MHSLLLPILAAASAASTGAEAQSAPDAHVLRRERGDVIDIREVEAPIAGTCHKSTGQRVGGSVGDNGSKARHDPGKTVPPRR